MAVTDTVEIGATLGALASTGPVDVPGVLKALQALLLEESHLAFRQQGWRGGTAWAPRMTPNVPALLRALDREGASSWRKRWGQDRPALEDTGRLRQSMTTRATTSPPAVELGTNVEYAALHQTGGRVTLPGAGRGSANPKIRPRLFKVLKTAPEAIRRQLGWLYGMDEVTFNVRARPVVEMTPAVMAEVKKTVARFRLGGEER